jgi:hypothetical protein
MKTFVNDDTVSESIVAGDRNFAGANLGLPVVAKHKNCVLVC